VNASRGRIFLSAALGKISSVIGYSLAFFGLFGFIYEITEDGEAFFIGFSLFIVLLGVFFILMGVRIKRRIRRFRRYVTLISVKDMVSLDNIAVATSRPVDFVRRDLQKMIDKRFFKDATIDYVRNEINIGQRPAQEMAHVGQSQTVVFSCSGCGATGTKTEGVPNSCGYCGTLN